MCIVITSGPVIKIDAGATPFLGNVLESWHGDGGATAHLDLEVLLCRRSAGIRLTFSIAHVID